MRRGLVGKLTELRKTTVIKLKSLILAQIER